MAGSRIAGAGNYPAFAGACDSLILIVEGSRFGRDVCPESRVWYIICVMIFWAKVPVLLDVFCTKLVVSIATFVVFWVVLCTHALRY